MDPNAIDRFETWRKAQAQRIRELEAALSVIASGHPAAASIAREALQKSEPK